MNILLTVIFACVAAAALAFACWPLWRGMEKGRGLLVAALAVFMIAIATGSYIFVGHPYLALRSIEKPDEKDPRALVSTLAWRMRKTPGDPRGWFVLGRGYLYLQDAVDAAAAFRRAIPLVPLADRPLFLSAYGEALTLAASGNVTPEAEAAFRAALAIDPKDVKSRFYLGEAYAERRDAPHALALWQSLLADSPPNAPWRGLLLDRIAMLTGAARTAPNIAAMVQRLADRLKQTPDDPEGWLRLVRAYVVLGETDKAKAALADARQALAGHVQALGAITAEARALRLEK